MALPFCSRLDLSKDASFPWTNFKNKLCLSVVVDYSRRQRQCIQSPTIFTPETSNQTESSKMASSSKMTSSSSSSSSKMVFPIIVAFVVFLLVSSLPPVFSLPVVSDSGHRPSANQTFRPLQELQRLKRVRAYLRKVNKPSVKTIQSPDGDVIDCVFSHLQPAFDHPQLKGQTPLEPPERPKGHDSIDAVTESFQPWTNSGESCPEGTIPIRRTSETDVLRANSIRDFGRKLRKGVRHDTMSSDHEHAVAFVNGEEYYGAKANINVWAPSVADRYEFSLSQLWVISGTFGNDLNTIEAGWQVCYEHGYGTKNRTHFTHIIPSHVSPELYGDNYPRFFTYWTSDAYQATGCYNLLCSGFVQTNNRIAIGAAISPTSSYRGRQFDIGMTVWMDPKHGHWWLEFGSGLLVGYWPSFLFSHLRQHASMIQFGGEIVNSRSQGYHTATQMGSGRFADDGFGRASYFRNLQVVDWDNNLIPLSNLHLLADHPNCYDIKAGRSGVWGDYFYYGGPGRNFRCP